MSVIAKRFTGSLTGRKQETNIKPCSLQQADITVCPISVLRCRNYQYLTTFYDPTLISRASRLLPNCAHTCKIHSYSSSLQLGLFFFLVLAVISPVYDNIILTKPQWRASGIATIKYKGDNTLVIKQGCKRYQVIPRYTRPRGSQRLLYKIYKKGKASSFDWTVPKRTDRGKCIKQTKGAVANDYNNSTSNHTGVWMAILER